MGFINGRSGDGFRPAPLLEVKDLQTEFVTERGVLKAVSGVSFDVMPGELVGLVGESGSGKTITMLSVMRLIESPPGRINQGQVLFNGVDLLKQSEAEMRRLRGGKISMIFQDPLTALNPVFSVGEQLLEVIQLHLKLERRAATNHAQQVLARVGLPDPARIMEAFPHQLSGGMRQRVMIAMAIACEPVLLIGDEPTTALDVTVQEQILQLIEDLHNQFKLAVIWITHDLGVIAGLVDRVMVMYAGEIVEQGPTELIFETPRHPYTQALLRSIPRLDTPSGLPLVPIEGAPPDPARMPPGCRFAPRCRHQISQCAEHPDLIPLTSEQLSRCWVNPAFSLQALQGRE